MTGTALDLERNRERVSLEAMQPVPTDLADLTDAEFEGGLKRVKVRQERMARILKESLVEGAHYGNPETNGRKAFKKPILFKAGAEELRTLMRFYLERVKDDVVIATPDFCSVTVTLGIFDRFRRLLAVKAGACTTAEKRFQRFDGKGPTWKDAREELHNCTAMAEKRAGGLVTCEVTGATAFFANAETMDEVLEGQEDTVITPWSAAEKKEVYAEAAAAGIGRNAFAKLVMKTLGRAQVGTGIDVAKLRDAIKAYGADPAPVDEPREPGED